MPKQINITDIKVIEINLLPQDNKGNISYALLDAENREYDSKRAGLEKSEFTAGELADILKVVNLFKNKIKLREQI